MHPDPDPNPTSQAERAPRTREGRIEAALRGLLAQIDDPRGDSIYLCDRDDCNDLALVESHGETLCDDCATDYPARARRDRSYAPAVRAARAALSEVP
jgi:hypothetical protein